MPDRIERESLRAWTLAAGRVAESLRVDPETGLDSAAAADRLARHGPNDLGETRFPGPAEILLAQFRGAIFWLLMAAAALSLWMQDRIEALAIAAVLILNGLIGFSIELRAMQSMQALRAMSRMQARVRRDGAVRQVAASELVPGDLVLLDAGELVPADLRLIAIADLHCDESALTGESVPVVKSTSPLDPDTPLAERANMAFRGTAVTRGIGTGLVVATGADTELGQIADLVAAAEERRSPLEKRLEALGRQLAWAAMAAVAALAALGLAAGQPAMEMIRTAVALAVAAVPEGLPVVATLALARGMWRMARRNVLVNRLSAIETLGSVGLILTDKTGTLTENRMTVAAVLLPDAADPANDPALDRPGARALLAAAALCCDTGETGGDPMERAICAAAAEAGSPREGLLAEAPRTRLLPFDPERKVMASVHRATDHDFVVVKGAPEAIVARSIRAITRDGPVALDDAARAGLVDRAEAAARRGLRLLGVARRDPAGPTSEMLDGLDFLGFLALHDPPRQDVRAAIERCKAAGLRIVMVTGDHPATARRIAEETGVVGADAPPGQHFSRSDSRLSQAEREQLVAVPVFARIAPRSKLDLVSLHQEAGAVVAMIGDGINDAPALKKADIGIAMGQRGTQVAVEASDIVLRDDSFASIVAAVHEGRVIFGNIRLFIRYLFACNLSEMLVVGGALALGMPLPLLPMQLLFLNLVTDVFPALALGAGEGPRDIMSRPPRPADEPLIGRRGWTRIVVEAAVIATFTLATFAAALGHPEAVGTDPTTIVFLSLAFAQIWHIFALRERGEALWDNAITRNRFVWGALALSTLLILAGTFTPPVSGALDLRAPDATGWALALAAGPAALATNTAIAAFLGRGSPNAG
ncbi:MAG TPA: cation-transporting P-type ATPase [Amaricoccus sp.]|uniref:cation-translocating P-type ATPase n=1 Tax=Amaricoccus sp. TaxID=1872485 RepID=UPI002BC24007|nr:cation-transporting P-type ATPase [Amaricoccus sp.]HMQ94083.1 cation-transporting P-type ATPase [Amaricoccus sp.]HMR53963.1 cation-transporting P-type ATPase [Amaricoccus sp.]HMR61472.1 cation-transporting P-type ATPase [Amaricoccus sp.]HMU00959.1 cation-transporting P-type ATPase [Amaricoccus sp.]